MKKEYISPELFMEHVELQHIICTSITEVTGDAEIENGGDEEDDGTPVSADSRRKSHWDDEEEEDDSKW